MFSAPANAVASDSQLTNLTISPTTLSATFDPTVTSYTASVPNNTSSVSVTPVFSATGETVTVNGVLKSSGQSLSVNLVSGVNTITVVGTATDGTTTTYTVTITVYTITYALNNATSGSVPSSETVTAGTTYTVQFNSGNLKRTDFRYMGWSTDPSDGTSSTIYNPGTDAFAVTGNITLYASWNNPYGFGLYVDKPFVQNSYIYDPLDLTTKLETADTFTVGTGNCPTTIAIGTISNSSGCNVNSSGIYGGASTTSASPTVGNSTPGSRYMGAPINQGFTINFPAPQAYFGMWWSGASPTDTIQFYSGTKLLATMTTSNLMTKLSKTGSPNPNSTDYSTNTISGTSSGVYPKGYYYGNPRVYDTLTPTSFPTTDITGTGDSNFITYTGQYIYGYIHAFGSGGVTFDNVRLSGGTAGGFEFDNVVISSTPRTPAAYLVKDSFYTSSNFVTFNRNGSTTGAAIADQVSTTPANLTSNTYTRAGFTFGGWNTKADGTGRTLANSAQYSFDSNITLYAVWTPFTVTGAAGVAGSGTVAATDSNNDGAWNLVATPSAGYRFTSWSCSASQTPASTTTASTTLTPSANTACTATFTANSVTPAVSGSTGGTVTATDANSDGTWDLVATPDAGYSFAGWACVPSQTIASATSTTTTVAPSANATCTATFTANPSSTPAPNNPAPNNPAQTDSITNSPSACYADEKYVVTGTFNLAISSVVVNGTALRSSEWKQTTRSMEIKLPVGLTGSVSIQIYNGAVPLLTAVTCVGSQAGTSNSGSGATPTPTPSPTPITPSPTATPTPTPSAATGGGSLKPSATSVRPGGNAKVVPNQLSPLKEVVKLNVPSGLTLKSVIFNGKKLDVTLQNNEIVLPTVVGPNDKLVMETENGTFDIPASKDLFSIANVNFDVASAVLTPEAKRILNSVASVIQKKGFKEINLVGYTDSQGVAIKYDNQTLSQYRAVAVRKYLLSKLGAGVTVRYDAKAHFNPVASNDTKAGQLANRRVEIGVR